MAQRPPKPTRAQRRGDPAVERLVRRSLQLGARALYRDAALFDQLYRRRSADVRFYVEVASRYGGPVLELGIGTGRVAFALARAGFDVVGIDTMPEMLARARERSAKLPARSRARLSFRRDDMRKLALGQRFPLVIAPFNAFTHLYSLRDLERALASCRRQLRPRGRLVFDVMLPELRALTQNPARAYRGRDLIHPGDGQRRSYHEASHYDAVRQIRSVTMLFETPSDPASQLAIPLAQRQFFPAELEALLHYNGFAIEARYGDFAGGALSAESETQVVIARARTRSKRAR